MADTIVLTSDILKTEGARSREALTARYVATMSDAEKILAQCEIAYDGLGQAPSEGLDAWLKEWAKELSFAAAKAAKPHGTEADWNELAQRDGRKPDGKKVSHTALKHRARAWRIALLQGTPNVSTITDAFRLASTTGKGSAVRVEAFEKSLTDNGAYESDAEFAKAASAAAKQQDAVNQAPRDPNKKDTFTFDADGLRQNLDHLLKNLKALDEYERKDDVLALLDTLAKTPLVKSRQK